MPKSTSPTAREREVHRYFQPSDISAPSDPSDPSRTRQSSSDPLLTALAQLGAHRLKAKRGLVTLSTRDTEYILAESTIGLGLQQDDDKNDPLWHGAGALKKECGLGMQLCKYFGNAEEELSYAVFDDLRNFDQFKAQIVSHQKANQDRPEIRFLACAPLRSPLYNQVIGIYIIVDDKPRDGLSEDEIEFLIELGVTVMDHLEAQRNNRKQYRAERMLKGVSLFIEGKSTLREWWLQGGHRSRHTAVRKRSKNGGTSTLEGQADVEFGVQDPVESVSGKGMEGFSDQQDEASFSRSPSTSTLSHLDRRGDGRPTVPSRDSMFSSSDTTIRSAVFSQVPRAASITTVDTTEGSAGEHMRHSSVAFDMPPEHVTADVSKELQEALLTRDLKAVFSRASNLIREAGSVDGSIFFDASVGSFGAASEADVMGQKAPGNFHIDETTTASEDDLARKSSDTDTSTKQSNGTNLTENCCSILGFSTRNRSSLKGHSPPPEHHTFPERVLRTLLKRYPHGKVFNFEEDGSFSSSDTDNAYLGGDNEADGPRRFAKPESNSRRKRVSREVEAAALRQALPGARSIFWFPLWDPSRERWYAGSLVWTCCPTRTLCPIEDLTYLAAFGNSIMAEVARLSALVITQLKTDFISSISHELRSPLHGVLASVEFLQETALTEVQADMVSNIFSSGRVLLDTINHVLDFSKVNKKMKTKGKISKSRSGKKARLSFQDVQILDNASESKANLSVLSEEVLESVWAGRNMSKLAYDTSTSAQRARLMSTAPTQSPVTIVMDVSWRPNWDFEIDAGAWRRILLNLFGNSMKYTQSGFIHVSLSVEENATFRGKKARSTLVLRVKDSGKGISKEFLKHHLYKPFTQEDSLAVRIFLTKMNKCLVLQLHLTRSCFNPRTAHAVLVGTGLGLSIVRHIIQDLGGEISFSSEQGSFTEATVKLPLLASPTNQNATLDAVAEGRKSATGKTFRLEGFDRYPDISETPTGILSSDVEAAMLLKSSVHTLLTNWFGMKPSVTHFADKSPAEVLLIMESGSHSLTDRLQLFKSESGPFIVIVLCDAYPPASTPTTYGSLRVFHVPQPYGPYKIAKTLHHAFSQFSSPGFSTETNDQAQNGAHAAPVSPAPPSNPAGGFFPKPQLNNSTSPAPAQVISPSPLGTLDRRTSIDTSVVQPGGMRVLLVEDNEINMKLLVAYMRKLKLNHATAINGLEALNAYKEANGDFDVIFMDISMPIMSGIESTRHIRRFERENSLHPVALIALTGAANPNTRQEAFSSGVDLYLTKPIAMKSLKVMLDDLKINGRQGLTD